MTDYCTTADVKAYISTSEAGDDAIIASLITRASAAIDSHCQRTFVGRTETRTFDALRDVEGGLLILDDDLLSISALTNGDGDPLVAADYTLEPANSTPKWAIRLKASRSKAWTYTTDPEQAISVAGKWGYALYTPPNDIIHAAVRLTAWYYHQRNAPFEQVGFPDTGQVITPASIPQDIAVRLDAYRRIRL